MTAKQHTAVLDCLRNGIREVSEPFLAIDGSSEAEVKIAENLKSVGQSCAPARRHQQLKRLCQSLEAIIDGKVSGWLSESCAPQISGLTDSIRAIQKACEGYCRHVGPNRGFVGGWLRSAMQIASKPWEILTVHFGATDYQRKRDAVAEGVFAAMDAFGENLTAFILSVESAITLHTGEDFKFNQSPIQRKPSGKKKRKA